MKFYVLDTVVLQGQFSLISEQQESMFVTVILEMYKRISNMLSAIALQCSPWTEMSPHLQSFYLLSLEQGGQLGRAREKGVCETTELRLGLGGAAGYCSVNGFGLSS